MKIGVQDVLKHHPLVKEKTINKFAVSIVNFIEYNAQSIFSKCTDYTPVSGKVTLVNVKAKDCFHYLDPLRPRSRVQVHLL